MTDILDNKRYRSYTQAEEWQPFFGSLAKLAKQITKKASGLEKESESYKRRYEEAFAEKEEAMALLSQEKERSDKLEIDYDTLQQDVAGLIRIEKLFNEMKAKQQETNELLSEKSRALAELRPRVQQYEAENRKLARDVERLEGQLEESVNELTSIK